MSKRRGETAPLFNPMTSMQSLKFIAVSLKNENVMTRIECRKSCKQLRLDNYVSIFCPLYWISEKTSVFTISTTTASKLNVQIVEILSAGCLGGCRTSPTVSYFTLVLNILGKRNIQI